jgi:hypothetical protein
MRLESLHIIFFFTFNLTTLENLVSGRDTSEDNVARLRVGTTGIRSSKASMLQFSVLQNANFECEFYLNFQICSCIILIFTFPDKS